MKPTRSKSRFGSPSVLVGHGLWVWAALFGSIGAACAQDRAPSEPGARDANGAAESGGVNEAQSSLGRRYRQFERTLLQMAEYLRKTEPERADLLIRAIGKSKEDRVALQMDQIIELLKSEQLGDAIGREEHLVTNLKGLLELLQSEDRRHQLEEEKKWLESVHQEVGRLSVREKELRRATEGRSPLGPLAERQQKIGGDTNSLLKKIDKQDAARNAANRQNPSDKSSQSTDGQNGKEGAEEKTEKENAQKEKSDKEKGDKENPDGSTKPGKKGGKQDKQNSQGKPGESKKQDGAKQNGSKQDASKQNGSKQNGSKPDGSKQDSSKKQQSQKPKGQGKNSQKQSPPEGKAEGQPEESNSEESESDSSRQERQKNTPGREQIEQARRAMQQAEEELKRLQGDKALERQDEAIRKLAEARERLEKILRQLREEEQEIMLTSLEARFAKMLLMEIQLHLDTVTLGKTAKNAWTARHFGKARELSVQQESVADDAAKALTLLKEEGSSVAFPQGVEQVRDDMLTIARSLGKNDVGEWTQSIQKDVIESLEELVASLQSEIENRKKPEGQRRRRQRAGEQGDKQLVEQIAELKMLRSLQLRVNRRTKEIGRRIRGEQATNDELAAQLQSLARRQAEIQEATYILASGRNQ